MKSHEKFCHVNGIPLPKKGGFYFLLAELGKRKPSDASFLKYAEKELFSRLEEVDEFLVEARECQDYPRFLNGLRLYCEYAEQYLKIKANDGLIRDELEGKRLLIRYVSNLLENPQTNELLEGINKVPKFRLERILKRRAKIISRDAYKLGIENWAFADRWAGVAFEGRGWSYP